MSETTGTFMVTEVEDEAAILQDVETGQVHTLGDHPDLERHEVLEATLSTTGAMDVIWSVDAIEERRAIELVDSDLSPTRQAKEMAEGTPPGEVVREERAGEGEIHVVTVPEGHAEAAATDVLEDEATVARAARLGAVRVEVRTGEGFVNVRYLPD